MLALRRLALGLALALGAPAGAVEAPAAPPEQPCPEPVRETSPRVRAVRFDGPGVTQLATLRARTGFAIDQPATPDLLVRVVNALAEEPRLGGLDVRVVSTDRDKSTAELIVIADGRVRRITRVAVTTGREGVPDEEESWRLVRQVQSEGRALLLTPGRQLHPLFARLDEELITRVWRKRGHRDAVVRSELEQQGDLVSVVFRVLPGPRYTVSDVKIDGPPLTDEGQRKALMERLKTRPEEGTPYVADAVAEDAEAVRAQYCAQGFADATVVPFQRTNQDRVGVRFQVTPGALYAIGAVVIEGYPLSDGGRKTLPVAVNRPYCGDLLLATERALVDWLCNHGRPDAVVEVEASPMDTPPVGPRRVRITARVSAATEVRVTRIWFEGNHNTREDILRQLLSVEEGDLYRERALQTSVQNLLRSGLVRRAEVQSVRGANRAERYLIFSIQEQDPIGIDLVDQTLTLRNLDLTQWPEGFDELGHGTAFRGAGQQLQIVGQPDYLALRFRNRFLHRYLLAEGELAFRTQTVGPEEEDWLEMSAGIGVKFLQNRISVVPYIELDVTDLPPDASFDPLPLSQGQSVEVQVGATARVDVNVRDDERIPYLGVDSTFQYAHGSPALGSDLDLHLIDARAALNLPLGTNDAGAHYVLRLAGRYGQLWADGPVTAHRRLVPVIRGFGSSALGIPFDGVAGSSGGRLGGDRVVTATAEVRLPIPPLRRNAVAPFLDTAAVAHGDTSLFDGFAAAVGGAYYFSFFSERLEGFVYGAVPVKSDASAEYLGAGIGGSF